MRRTTKRNDFYKVAYSESHSYYESGYVTDSGDWMRGEERTSYQDDFYGSILKDLNRRATSMRV